jgi:IMP dehydrogenase
MKTVLAFDDVLLVPKFSHITSRKDVDISTSVGGRYLDVPIISSNMDTVTSYKMTHAMEKAGGAGCLHRFWSIDDNVNAYKNSAANTWVSVGLGKYEFERALALVDAGASTIIVDVANGASMGVVNQARDIYNEFRGNIDIVVGNFATKAQIDTFTDKSEMTYAGYKIGVGGGSACLTRMVTGCGLPTFASLVDCLPLSEHLNLIADGGIRNSGDLSKALAAGAKAVMCGAIFAGALESPGTIVNGSGNAPQPHEKGFKKYRGSASLESYAAQGKQAFWRAPEGESFLVPYVGPVQEVIQGLEGGLRSSMSYMNAATLAEFRYNAEFVQMTRAGSIEGTAHGRS